MASESELADLVQLGHDITSFKLYAIGMTALWFFDYFLTLDDEISYTWGTESSPMYILFLLTRYVPAPFLVWTTIASWSSAYTSEMCQKTGFFEAMYFTFISTFAQIVLTQRTYAITRKNAWVAGILYTVVIAQLSIGLYNFIYPIGTSVPISAIPLDSFHLCLANVRGSMAVTQVSLYLGFDVTVLVLVVVRTRKIESGNRGTNVPSFLGIISRDTVIYFMVVSSSHFVVVITYAVERPMFVAISIVGNSVLIPLMTTRMIISLKKAVGSRQSHLSLEAPSGLPMNRREHYSPRQMDDIELSAFNGEQPRQPRVNHQG